MHRGRFVLACLAAAFMILWAPFAGEVRRWIRTQFPGHFVLIVGSVIALIIGAAILATLVRIRERRLLRYGALAAALVLGVGYALRYAQGRAEVDVVERVHFVEFGLVTLLFYRAWRPLGDWSVFVLSFLAGLLVGTLEEWFQWFIPVRVGEMRDIFLNSAAIASGLLFSVALDPPGAFTGRLHPGSLRRLGRWFGVVVVALGAFFHTVHLGYEIDDAEIGRFRSRYTAEQLSGLSSARSAEWRKDPPPLTVHRLSREDQYLTEGIEHVMERNRLWESGDAAGAWHEDRILEKYYAPAAGTPSYHAPAGSRWPDEQRRNAELAATLARESVLDTPVFVSASNPAPIYTWPKQLYWLVVAAIVAVTLGFTAWLDRRPAAVSPARA